MIFAPQERLCQDDMTLKATSAALVEAMDAAVEEGSLASWRTADTWEDRVRNPARVSPSHCVSSIGVVNCIRFLPDCNFYCS